MFVNCVGTNLITNSTSNKFGRKGGNNYLSRNDKDFYNNTNLTEIIVYAPRGILGLSVDITDIGPPIVYSIDENSPLIEQILRGDRLITVDEIDVSNMTSANITKLISSRSNQSIRKFTILREFNKVISMSNISTDGEYDTGTEDIISVMDENVRYS